MRLHLARRNETALDVFGLVPVTICVSFYEALGPHLGLS
jgi:hypothetical protein